ncbi:MAG TPA: response regulator [Verrucomicrobiae bacterium]|nr:response regulator [Verrucomicrobiae bacterium]
MKETQHNVLFVDDDREFLEALSDMFNALSGGAWKIQTAGSPDAAAEILKAGEIKLMVVDVNMPVLDGIQFTGMMRKRYPALKVALLTSDVSDEKRSAALEAGAELFIEKTHSPEGMKAVFTMLGELLNWAPQDGFQGMLHSVSLQDVIQMECVGYNSSVIEICNEHVLGRIYIEDGQIIHAAGGELMGERALQKLLSLPGGSFELVPFEAPQQRTMNAPWELLIAETTRKVELGMPRMDGPEVDAATMAPVTEAAQNITETLVCTGTGAPLYDAGCAEAQSRMHWLMAVAQQAAIFNQTCSLGHFDRLDIQYPEGRAVAQAREDRLVYVRMMPAKKGSAV